MSLDDSGLMALAEQDQSVLSKGPAATFDRLLLVLEEIAMNGPVTLSELSDVLSISRGAIWRVTQVLRRRGWVRARCGDNAFELSLQVDEIFGRAHVAYPESTEFEPLLAEVQRYKTFHASIGLFIKRGQFVNVDATRRQANLGQSRSLVFDELALAAQIGCSAAERAGHLKSYLNYATREEQKLIENGAHERHVASYDKTGLVWAGDTFSISTPVFFKTGSRGGVSFAVRDASQRSANLLQILAETLLAARARGDTENNCLDLLRLLATSQLSAQEPQKHRSSCVGS